MTDETLRRSDRPQCAQKDCSREPTHYLVLKVPPQGMRESLRGTLALQLCRDHAHETTVADVRKHGGGDLNHRIARGMGLALPDWTRAELEVRRLGDKNWQLYAAHLERVAKAGAA